MYGMVHIHITLWVMWMTLRYIDMGQVLYCMYLRYMQLPLVGGSTTSSGRHQMECSPQEVGEHSQLVLPRVIHQLSLIHI